MNPHYEVSSVKNIHPASGLKSEFTIIVSAKCEETAKNSDYGRLLVVIFENLEDRWGQLMLFSYQFFYHLPHLGVWLDALGCLQMRDGVRNASRQLR